MRIGRKRGNPGLTRLLLLAAAALGAALLVPRDAAASGEQVLYSFCGQVDCTDGLTPAAGLVMDAAGNLYGTTYQGGTTAVIARGGGVVFKLAPDGTQSVLYSFCPQSGCADGYEPLSDLVIDGAGNLYGTTFLGATPFLGRSAGVVYKLAPDGTQSVLYSFCAQPNCADGASPGTGSLIMDAAGNLYGMTLEGGNSVPACGVFGCGLLYKLAPDGTETVLYSFCAQPNCADGVSPVAGLIMDGAGNLYGTTAGGGTSSWGVVFRLAPDGTYTVLYNFCSQANCADGAQPYAGLIMDAAGNLYGTTQAGGTSPFVAGGAGVAFKLAPDGTYTVLYSFCSQASCADGANLAAGLIADAAGNLYGTAQHGGTSGHDAGVVFALAPDGTETVLYSFCSVIFCFDGFFPAAGLITDIAGNLYGTAQNGGSGSQGPGGVVFEVTP